MRARAKELRSSFSEHARELVRGTRSLAEPTYLPHWWQTLVVSFSAEERRLRDVLQPGETILASDVLGGCRELPNLHRPPVLVVTDRDMYLLLSGRDEDIIEMPFESLAGVGRRTTPLGRELQLIFKNNEVFNFTFHHRDRRGLTGDLITERFFGRVVKETTLEFPQDTMEEMLAEEVLTLEEVAVLLRSDRNALLTLAETGILPGRQIGDEWRFSRVAVLAWLGGGNGS